MTTLVIDVGSSSVRALLFDADNQLIPDAQSRREHHFAADATANSDELRQQVETCIDAVLAHSRAAAIKAVGMATFVGNMVGLDAERNPVTPLYTYADIRSHDDALQLAREFNMQAVHARTGCRIHPAYHPARLHWLKRTQPNLYERVTLWTDFASACYSTWFGCDVPTSYSVASWSGLLDRHTLQWDAQWRDYLQLADDALPALADMTTVQTGLSHTYAQRWPGLRDVPFYLAVGDGAAANIGSGGTTPDRPVLTVGTTAALRIVTKNPGTIPLGLWCYRVDADRHLVGGATSEGGNVFGWAREALRLDRDGLDATLAGCQPGAHGLTVLPLLAGERSPGYQASASGTIHGLRLDTRPLDMLHALLESVALRLRLIYELMGTPGDNVLAGGGALVQSKAWAQIMADALSVPLHLADTPQATARGVALLIAEHQRPDDAPLTETPHATIITPRPGSAAVYAELLNRQRELYQRLYD